MSFHKLASMLVSVLLISQVANAVSAAPAPRAIAADDVFVLSGFVWYDDNENGELDAGEERAAGAVVRGSEALAKFLPGVPVFTATTTTNTTGQYSLALPRGKPYLLGASARREPGPRKLPGPNYRVTHILDIAQTLQDNELKLNLGLQLDSMSPASTTDYEIQGGRFFEQTGGRLAARGYGFAVTNAEGVPFWDTWQRFGLETIGYPVSQRFMWKGFLTQVFQKAVFQWRPEVGQVYFINTFDELHNAGYDPWLLAYRATPIQLDPSFDAGKSWEEIVRDRLALLDENAAIKARYFAAPDPLMVYGLPTSRVTDMGNH